MQAGERDLRARWLTTEGPKATKVLNIQPIWTMSSCMTASIPAFLLGILLCMVSQWLLRLAAPQGVADALLRLHRWAVRIHWKRKSRNVGGRPATKRELVELIQQMSADNPLWGAPRIHGELLKLGFQIAQSTVSKYLSRRPSRPVPNWKVFLHSHADAIAGIDMFTVSTIRFERLYAVVVLGIGRRQILQVDVTTYPTALWLAQQITEAFPWDTAPKALIRDNDRAYGQVFRRRVNAMGAKDQPTTPFSPWQNGYVERVIGSIRREAFDHIIILNAPHLRRVLRCYAAYYNTDRTHLGLGKDTPDRRAVESAGTVHSMPILGGLHHSYFRTPPR